MVTVRCLICKNGALRLYIDDSITRGLSNRGIAAAFEAAGGKLDPDVIGRHKSNHYVAPVAPDAIQPTKRDLAIMLRDKVAAAIEPMSGEALLENKDYAAMVGQGLKAQQTLDRREVNDKKLGLAAGALGFQLFLAGLGNREDDATPPQLLEDPDVIEGSFEPVDPDATD